MDNHNAVMCSYQVIQELLGIGEKTVARAIKVLKDNKFIDILKSGKSNVYAINDTVYWKSWQNNRKYSKFSGNIVLALSEQEEDYQIKLEDIEADKIKSLSLKAETEKTENKIT